jgi:hypothetical protein
VGSGTLPFEASIVKANKQIERLIRLEIATDKAVMPEIKNIEARLRELAAGAEHPDERTQHMLTQLSDRELLRIAFPNG